MKKSSLIFLLTVCVVCQSFAQEDSSSHVEIKTTQHFQLTVISQGHPDFHSPYSGANSLSGKSEWNATSMTSTLFLGRKLWKGAAFYFNPEISGGMGLSGSEGVAGALNGEIYRVGNPAPKVYIARAYLQQQISLNGKQIIVLDDDINQIKQKVSSERITISAGKFSLDDFFDDNQYSHDPRTQFLNWSLMANGAWDYPANTRGYNYGLVVEYFKQNWVFRLSSAAVPIMANYSKMEYRPWKAHAEALEITRTFSPDNRPANIRFLIAQTFSRAPSYQSGIKAIQTNDTYLLDVFEGNVEAKSFGGKKFTIGINADKELSNSTGIFARAGWNDGKYATWAFTEIDRTLSIGTSIKGNGWRRPNDNLGIAIVANGISKDHRNFLKDGGNGFILGDGKLNYGLENILEVYYSMSFTKFFNLSFDYQFVNNPGYNKDRGPVNVFGFRGHVNL